MSSQPASIFSGRPLNRTERIVFAVLVGLACALGVWAVVHRSPELGVKDFTYPWRAARALLAGQDPYVVIQPAGRYPYESRFPYPLVAAFVALPVAWLPAPLAASLFFGGSATVLTWALLGTGGLWRLWLLVSVPFAMSLALVQWPPLLVAGALLPAFSWALACKPTLGLALFAAQPSRAAVVAGAVLVAISLIVLPTWPAEWLRAVSHVAGHPAFVTRPFGWIPLLALLRWRDGDARLVALMVCVPQNPYFYDQLPLLLVARTGRSAFALSALSGLAYLGTSRICSDPNFCGPESEPWVLWLLYVPATALVLARGWPAWRARLRRHRDAAAASGPPRAAATAGVSGTRRRTT